VPSFFCQAAERRDLSQTELTALLDHMEAELKSVRTMTAEFTQEKHLAIFLDVMKSRGRLFFRRPDAVRFEMLSPFKSVMIASGKSVAKYEFRKGKWEKLKLGSPDVILMVTKEIATWLEGRLRARGDMYEITASKGDSTIIKMTPRHEEFRKFITAIELTMKQDNVRVAVVTIREPGGDFTQMTYVDVKENVELPPAVFDASGAAPKAAPAPGRQK